MGERFALTLLDKAKYCNPVAAQPSEVNEIADFWKNYETAYGPGTKITACSALTLVQKDIGKCIPIPKAGAAAAAIPALAPLATAAIGLATDFLKQKMEEEKGLYTAQYTAKLVDDKFWTVNPPRFPPKEYCKLDDGTAGERQITEYPLSPNYIGFKAERTISNTATPAAKFYYGFNLSGDGRFMQIRPLYLNIAYAKAKVLSNEWFTWLPPVPLIMKLFKVPDESVDVELAVSMEAYWIEKGKSFDGPKTIAAFKTSADGYSMNNAKGKDSTAILGPNELNIDPGWLFAPPISGELTNYSYNAKAGNFKLTLSVTERDTSEATKFIGKSEEWLSKGSEQLTSSIEK
ncbi:hypothetical protein C2U68_09580 [Methylomonas koyamae]|nr:hypothetical protein C2U68_09580 [Methylomonas koyamae]